jgi:hypothetical protein
MGILQSALLAALAASSFSAAARAMANSEVIAALTCTDSNRVRVTSVFRKGIETAYGSYDAGRPVIVMDPVLLDHDPLAFDYFVYEHECAHHALGHDARLYRTGFHTTTAQDEFEADCFAYHYLRDVMHVTAQDFATIFAILGQSPRDPTHPAGPERVKRLETCPRAI